MSQQILFLGLYGEPTEINALWGDHNNVLLTSGSATVTDTATEAI